MKHCNCKLQCFFGPPRRPLYNGGAMPKKTPAPRRRDAGRPRGEPVEEAVLARTLEELATHGLEQLSVERIARAAELNKTSVYRRWPTRDALVAAALHRVAEELSLQVADTGTLRGDLLALASSVAAFIEQPVGRALLRAAVSELASPAIAELARAQLGRGAAGAVVAMIDRAQRRGEWRPGAEPQLVLSMLVGAILHRVILERQEPAGPWLGAVVELICGGVAPRR